MKDKIEKHLYACDSRLGDIYQYWLCNDNGVRVGILDYGLTITDFLVPDRNGDFVNIVLGFEGFASLREQSAYVNAIIGRYANRIGNSNFTVNGQNFILSCNENKHHLHGGVIGFDKRKWSIENLYSENEKCFLSARLISEDGEEGYPGVLDCTLVISLDSDNKLSFNIAAESNKATHINVTSHIYFNLTGHGCSAIEDHFFMIPSAEVLDIDSSGIPSGNIVPISGSSLDFTQPKALFKAIEYGDEEVEKRGGVDHCYVLKRHGELNSLRMAEVFCPSTGLKLQLDSTQPGVQFYTGQYLQDVASRDGSLYAPFAGFCLEPQHFPDTPNQPDFPPTLLFPGERYEQCFSYKINVSDGV